MSYTYFANVTKIEDSDLYFINFYDVDGAIGFSDFDNIEEVAKDSLLTMLSWLQQDGEPIPRPSTYEEYIQRPHAGHIVSITVDKLVNFPFCA